MIESKERILEQEGDQEAHLSVQAKEGIRSEITDYLEILRGLLQEQSLLKWEQRLRQGRQLFGGEYHDLKEKCASGVSTLLAEILVSLLHSGEMRTSASTCKGRS